MKTSNCRSCFISAILASLAFTLAPSSAQTIPNPSFEENTFTVYPGYVDNNGGTIAGWTYTGSQRVGLNPANGSPFASNGATPDGTNVAFVQSAPGGSGSLATTITGLTTGVTYRVSFRANCRTGDGIAPPDPSWSLNGGAFTTFTASPAVDAQGVFTNPYYINSGTFTATAATAALVISNNTAGDSAVLVDDFRIVPVWAVSPWTNDASSGISPTETVWAYNFGTAATATINGVSVPGIPGGNPSVAGQFTVTGIPNVVNNHANSLTALGGTGSALVASDFIYGGNPGTVTVHGLTVGQTYTVTFLGVGFDASPVTRVSVFSSGADTNAVDENVFGQYNGIRVDYTFQATATDRTITLAPTNAFTFHLCGLALRSATPGFTNVPIAGLPGVSDSSVAWGDYDNDGRLDFLLTGRDSGNNRISQLWRNTGSGFIDVTASVAPGLPQVSNSSVAWGDYDNDGRLDFLLTGNNGSTGVSQLWRNTGSTFTHMPIAGLPQVSDSSVAWGDYDNDGRLDFLLTGFSSTGQVSQLWQNTGSGFTNVPIANLPGVSYSSVAWGDYDNDGRLDFLLTGYPGVSQLWRNTGSGFTNVPIANLPGVSYSSVAWGDYDNDGRLDFLLTGEPGAPRVSQLWRNNGDGTFSNVTATATLGLPGVNSSSVAWGDYDNDGRLDFLLTGSSGVSQLWRNMGSTFTNVPIANLPGVDASSVAWADYDNDGRLDFLLTGFSDVGRVSQLWRNNTPVTNTPPSAPTGLAMNVTNNAVMLSWNSATDGQTPAPGLTYNVRAGSTPGGMDLFAGHVDAASGFRRVPAMGNAMLRHSLPLTGLTSGQTVYWSVQAVDTSFAGGPFATETTSLFTIVTTTANSGAGSLRAALDDPAASKAITFAPALSGQTITLTSGPLTLTNTLTIDASGLPGGIAISGNNSSRVLRIAPGANVTLASLTLKNGFVTGAAPAGNGAGILVENGAVLTVNRSTILGNTASAGGGIYCQGGTLNVNNSTLTGNSATGIGFGGYGGAIYVQNSSASVNQSTIAGNAFTAGGFSGGGGLALYDSTVNIVNSIVAGNSAPDITAISGGGPTGQDNLVGGTPLLAPLGHYGGPTPTMPPLPGSPAIDAATGSALTADQRGFPISDGDGNGSVVPDLGAAELQFGPATSVTTLAATGVTPTGATLNGTVIPGDLTATAWFQWGTTTNYGNVTATSLLAGTANTLPVTNNLSGLLPDTTYHYRAVASNAFGVSYGENQSFITPAFANVPIAGLPGVSYSTVAWGDYDDDGRLDFLLTGVDSGFSPISQLWRNTGSTFTNVPIANLPGVALSSVAWGDYDNDGRLDFLLTGYGVSQLWRNTGSTFTNVPIVGLPGVYDPSVAWGDYDNDGRLDFLLTGRDSVGSGISQLWRNTGSGFTNVPVANLPGVYGSSVAWGDYDNDGRLDFFLTGFNGSYISQLWRNTGSTFTNVPIASLPGVENSSVAWGDYDNDGRLDFLLTGFGSSGPVSQLWRNNTPVTNTPPTAPTGLAMTATPNAVMLSWNSATDGQTPATGLTYNVRAGTTPGGMDLFAGNVDATNGFRRVPAMGNALLRHSLPLTGLTNGQTVYWSVQAVDTSFAGGPFATETSVVTNPTLTITPGNATNALVSWTPPTWGWLLQESTNLTTGGWSNSASGELNPVSVDTTNAAKFYRLDRP